MAGTAELAILITGKDQASAALKGIGGGLDSMANKARTAGIALSAMGGALMAVLGLSIRTYTKMGDEVQKMALRTGFATETLSELRHAAEISGASLGDLETGIKRMQRAITEASFGTETYLQAFQRIGVNIKSLRALKPEDQFWALAEAIGSIKDPTIRAAMAQEIFGRSGTDLLPLFAQGKKGIKELREEAHKLGIVFSPEAASKAAEMNDALTRMKASLSGLKISLAEALVPALISFVNMLTAIVTKINEWAKQHPVLWSWLVKIMGVLALLGVTLGPILIMLPLLKAGFVALIGIFAGLIPWLVAVTAQVWAGVAAWLAYLASMGPLGWAWLATAAFLIGVITKQIYDYIKGIGAATTATKEETKAQSSLSESLQRAIELKRVYSDAVWVGSEELEHAQNVIKRIIESQNIYTDAVWVGSDALQAYNERIKTQQKETTAATQALENHIRVMQAWFGLYEKGMPVGVFERGVSMTVYDPRQGKYIPISAVPPGTTFAELATYGQPYTPYQFGGEVKETGPAFVHKGEVILPAGFTANVVIELDGEKVGEAVSRYQGNSYAKRKEFEGH